MTAARAIAKGVFTGIGVAVTAAFAVLLGVGVVRDQKRRRAIRREGAAA